MVDHEREAHEDVEKDAPSFRAPGRRVGEPHYRGAKMSHIAEALLRAKDPKVRAALEKALRATQAATEPVGVKPPLIVPQENGRKAPLQEVPVKACRSLCERPDRGYTVREFPIERTHGVSDAEAACAIGEDHQGEHERG